MMKSDLDKLTVDERLSLIKEVGEEILTVDELKELLANKEELLAYDGFEPSGNIHIAQGVLRAITVNKMSAAGVRYIFWVGDWFALMNNKLDGDLEKIKTTGEFFIEVWKASGMRTEKVEFLWASERMDQEYWLRTLQIARLNTVDRIKRCAQMMGRSESDSLSAAQIFYPCMQCSDVFELEVDIMQLGMDQRKVNVVAREVAPKLGKKKPIAVHHHMLMGLQHVEVEGLSTEDKTIAKKMSKSNPNSAIFMNDTKEEVERKFSKAYCPEGQVEDNPILEYFRYLIFERHWLEKETHAKSPRQSITIERPEKFGGDKEFASYEELARAFENKEVHPLDLKKTAAKYVNEMLSKARAHFENDPRAKMLSETVKSFEVTR